MAGLILPLARLKMSNGKEPNKIVWKANYYIQYLCYECRNRHSIHVTLRRHSGGYYSLRRHRTTVRFEAGKDFKANMLFAAMKMLDALDIAYKPESVRLVKA